MHVVELEDLYRAYTKGEPVLRSVNLTVDRGEVVGLLGRNGAGKTTVMRIALGMLIPQRGTVRIFGEDPRQEPVEVKRRIGYVSEEQILPGHLRIREVMEVHRALYPTWDKALARRMLDRFALDPGARVVTLSKGEARQAALVCAVSHHPELMLLDEPAGGLDPAARRQFVEATVELLNRDGSAILFSSHHMNDVERIAHRVAFLHDGVILIDRELDALRERCSLAVVEAAREVTPENLRDLPGCVRVRRKGGSLHAVFECEPEEVQHTLANGFGITDARCTRLGLEDLFVEIVEGRA